MTTGEMNARGLKKTGVGLAAALALAGMGGCASIAPSDSDGQALSPLSERVDALVRENRTYPRWIDFPAMPAAPPEPTMVAAEVSSLRSTGSSLQAQVDALTWELTEPEQFAQSVRARIDAQTTPTGIAQTAAQIEAFAQRLRERATAPPPLN